MKCCGFICQKVKSKSSQFNKIFEKKITAYYWQVDLGVLKILKYVKIIQSKCLRVGQAKQKTCIPNL